MTAWSEASNDHRLTVLEATEVGARVELVLAWAKDHLAELKVTEQIRTDVTEGVEKQQREYLLRQQLAAIRKELGEGDDDAVDDYRARLDAMTMPPKVRESVEKEIDRLERTSGQSPEQGWIRTWLDRVLDLPWGTTHGRQPRPAAPPARCSTPTTTASTTSRTASSSSWPCASCATSAGSTSRHRRADPVRPTAALDR